MGRPRAEAETRPCEHCGTPVTRTKKQQALRKYWTCGRSCANLRRIALGNTPTWGLNPHRGQKETRPCAVCGEPVTRYLSAQTMDRPWACSYACANRMPGRAHGGGGRRPRTGDTVACIICGKPFYRQPAYIQQGRKLCSRECNMAYQRRRQVDQACQQCGASLAGLSPSKAVRQFCSNECRAQARIKHHTDRLHNGRPVLKTRAGYLSLYEPGHPNANKCGRILEHRYVMSQVLGRPLTTDEHVDHINQDKTDNRPENLQVLDQYSHAHKTVADQRRKAAEIQAELAEARQAAARVKELEAQLAALQAEPPAE